MKGEGALRLTGGLVLLGLILTSRDLAWAWRHSPFDRGAAVVALVWLGAMGLVAGSARTVPVTRLLLAGVAAGFVGFVGELNVARHLALVLVASAWMPSWPTRLAAGVAGVAWWPAVGWVAAKFTGPDGALGMRGLILVAGLIGLWQGFKRAPLKGGD